MKTSADLQDQLDRINAESNAEDQSTGITTVLQRISTQIGKVDQAVNQSDAPLERPQAEAVPHMPNERPLEAAATPEHNLSADMEAAIARISAGLVPTASATLTPGTSATEQPVDTQSFAEHQPEPTAHAGTLFEEARQSAISQIVAEKTAQSEPTSPASSQEPAVFATPEPAVQSADGTDSETANILLNLQAQVTQIANQLERFDDMDHQLAQLASAVETARTATPELLRAAANEALAGVTAPEATADSTTNAGLKKLEDMFSAYIEDRRSNDDHTASAIDALQSAMLHLLDRLDVIEDSASPASSQIVEQPHTQQAIAHGEVPTNEQQAEPRQRTAHMAAEPAPETTAETVPAEQPAETSDTRGPLSKLFRRNKKTSEGETASTQTAATAPADPMSPLSVDPAAVSQNAAEDLPPRPEIQPAESEKQKWWKQDLDKLIEDDLAAGSMFGEDKQQVPAGPQTLPTESIAIQAPGEEGPAQAQPPEYLNAARIAAQQAKLAADREEANKPKKRKLSLFKRDKIATIAMGASAALIAGACATLVLKSDAGTTVADAQPQVRMAEASPASLPEPMPATASGKSAARLEPAPRERVDHAIRTGSEFIAPSNIPGENGSTRVASTTATESDQISGYVVPQGFSFGGQPVQTRKRTGTLIPRDLPVEPAALTPAAQPQIQNNAQQGSYISNVALPAQTTGTLPLRARAAAGDAAAQFEVASEYSKGKSKDYRQAAKWYKLSAAQGFALSQYRLAALYEQGKGLKRDANRARIWYRRAAEQGNVKAMHNLAVLYANRKTPDYKTAAAWFSRAAAHGLTDSQFNLGILHENGLGIPTNRMEAYKYFQLAARQGDHLARKSGDEVGQKLNSQQRDTIDRFVNKWQPSQAAAHANEPQTATAYWARKMRNAPRTSAQLTAEAQMLLTSLGYDAGPADGKIGPKTRQAIRNFELSRSLAPTGQVSSELIQRLRAARG